MAARITQRRSTSRDLIVGALLVAAAAAVSIMVSARPQQPQSPENNAHALVLANTQTQNQPATPPTERNPIPQPLLQPLGPAGSMPVYAAWVPPGRYTAFVISSNARDRRWIVTIRSSKAGAGPTPGVNLPANGTPINGVSQAGSFPVVLPPQTPVTIPFEGGWLIKAEDLVRIESQFIPFEDISQRNLMDGNDVLAISAWGITPDGPVNFWPPTDRRRNGRP